MHLFGTNFSCGLILFWCSSEYLWQHVGAHVHRNEETCHPVQHCGSFDAFLNVCEQKWSSKGEQRNEICQALATQTTLVRRIN